MSTLERIPIEILSKIVKYLPLKDRMALGTLSSFLRDAVEDHLQWKELLVQWFGKCMIPDCPSDEWQDWKGLYVECYKWIRNVETLGHRLPRGMSNKRLPGTKTNQEPIRLQLKPILASTTDGDQSIHYTVRGHYFWSSVASPSSESNEFLLYELPGLCVIDRVEIEVMQSRKPYPPASLCYELGFTREPLEQGGHNLVANPKTHIRTGYTSPETKTPSAEISHVNPTPIDQLPKAVGTWIRVDLLGKRNTHFAHGLESEYYVCLNNVSVFGWCLEPSPEADPLTLSPLISRSILRHLHENQGIDQDLLNDAIDVGHGYIEAFKRQSATFGGTSRWSNIGNGTGQVMLEQILHQMFGMNDWHSDFDQEDEEEESEEESLESDGEWVTDQSDEYE